MPYTGRDGLTHQETILDWDIKTKSSTYVPTPEESARVRKLLVDYRKSLAKRILACPAEMCGDKYMDFVRRDFEQQRVTWIKEMLEDQGIDLDRLRDMAVTVEKRWEFYQENKLSLKTPQIK